MNLGELIKLLETYPPNHLVRVGIGEPHSYRGDYMELAFVKTKLRTVQGMLDEARECVGKSFEAYEGGMFDMTLASDVYIVLEKFQTGEELTEMGMKYLLEASGKEAQEAMDEPLKKAQEPLIRPIVGENLEYFEVQEKLINELLEYVKKHDTPTDIHDLLTFTLKQEEYELMKLYRSGKLTLKEEDK